MTGRALAAAERRLRANGGDSGRGGGGRAPRLEPEGAGMTPGALATTGRRRGTARDLRGRA